MDIQFYAEFGQMIHWNWWLGSFLSKISTDRRISISKMWLLCLSPQNATKNTLSNASQKKMLSMNTVISLPQISRQKMPMLRILWKDSDHLVHTRKVKQEILSNIICVWHWRHLIVQNLYFYFIILKSIDTNTQGIMGERL